MALSDMEIKKYSKRLLLSRMRILLQNGFYGLLLMHVTFAIDENCPTAATDEHKIYFGTKFMDNLSDSELDFVLMHEILHIALNHCGRTGARDNELFNIACDIVVNSNILYSNNMDAASITLKEYGEAMHLTPDGNEGYDYTAEEVYKILRAAPNSTGDKSGKTSNKNWDDHSRWKEKADDGYNRDVWRKRVLDTAMSIQNQCKLNGALPLGVERMLQELRKPQTDWRTVLADFIQEEICDYSFSPPDKRFYDSPFFLPDFNETEIKVSDILFMIDTSGSMSNEMITAACSEVKGAIDQFNGKLMGWLGFFDAEVVKPKPFENEDEFKVIRPVGGGGTDFHIIFEYIEKHMSDNPPVSVIILTDGYAPFPDEKLSHGIPVLWLLNNDEVNPPWGRIARIHVD